MSIATSAGLAEPQVHAGVTILLALSDVTARLTLEAVLEKSGYAVDSAASSAEAMEKLESGHYALVLCDLQGESATASREVIKLAQTQDYRPATAYLTACKDEAAGAKDSEELFIAPVDIASLLTAIADLIANRAVGRAQRAVRRVRN